MVSSWVLIPWCRPPPYHQCACRAQLCPLVFRVDHIVVTWSIIRIEMIKLPILFFDLYHWPSRFCWWIIRVGGIEFFQKLLYLESLKMELSTLLKGALCWDRFLPSWYLFKWFFTNSITLNLLDWLYLIPLYFGNLYVS